MLSLSTLSLSRNRFVGTIPIQLALLFNLVRLQLQGNQLVGPIPSELGALLSLEALLLEQNELTGETPQSVCDLRSVALSLFVTDCPTASGSGVVCPVPDCCTFCRRGDSNPIPVVPPSPMPSPRPVSHDARAQRLLFCARLSGDGG